MSCNLFRYVSICELIYTDNDQAITYKANEQDYYLRAVRDNLEIFLQAVSA